MGNNQEEKKTDAGTNTSPALCILCNFSDSPLDLMAYNELCFGLFYNVHFVSSQIFDFMSNSIV